MLIMRRLPVVVLTILGQIAAQVQPDTNAEARSQNVCRELFDSGNATGWAATAVDNPLGVWRLSVHSNYTADSLTPLDNVTEEESPGAVANLWLDPASNTNLNSGTEFSACAFVFRYLPENTIRRGQNDDGSCEQTLSKKCVAQLNERAEQTAYWLVANPTYGPFSNLTPPILSPICQQVGDALGAPGSDTYPLPSACRPLFGSGDERPSLHIDVYMLTDNETKPDNCSLYQPSLEGPVAIINGWNNPAGIAYANESSPGEAYDSLVHQVWPVLTVKFPPANNTRPISIGSAYSSMSCLTATDISEGSRVPSPLPDPDPVKWPGQLSKAEIAGIVVGTVAGVALLAGLGWYCWRKRRTRQRKVDGVPAPSKQITDNSPHLRTGGDVLEVDGKDKLHQLDGSSNDKAEMPAQEPAAGELQANSIPPQEMMGSTPKVVEKS